MSYSYVCSVTIGLHTHRSTRFPNGPLLQHKTALGQTRKSAPASATFDLPPTSDITHQSGHFRKVPEAEGVTPVRSLRWSACQLLHELPLLAALYSTPNWQQPEELHERNCRCSKRGENSNHFDDPTAFDSYDTALRPFCKRRGPGQCAYPSV